MTLVKTVKRFQNTYVVTFVKMTVSMERQNVKGTQKA